MNLSGKYKFFIIGVSFLSAICGLALGTLAELMYSLSPTGHGWISGLLLGLLIGAIYALMMTYRIIDPGRMGVGALFGFAAGIALGLISSVSLHQSYPSADNTNTSLSEETEPSI